MELQDIQNQKMRNISYHIFQTLGTDKNTDYSKCEKNIANLKYYVDILEGFASYKSNLSSKVAQKKAHSSSRKIMRLVYNRSINDYSYENSNKSLDKLLKKNYCIKPKEKETNLSKDTKINNKKKLNKIITKKIIVKNNNEDKDNNKNVNKNEIFITHLDDISNSNNDSLYNNIGMNRYSEYIKNTEGYNTSSNKSHSLRKYLPPIKNSSNELKQKTSHYRNNTLNNLNDKCSYINQIINEDNKTFDFKSSEKLLNLQTENSLDGFSKYKNKKFLRINENAILKMIKRNRKVVDGVKHLKNNIEEASIDFETKYKYINWKFGIADMNKYFVDLDSYKKNEEELINKRKTFYDRLDDLIEDLKKRKKEKNFLILAKKFGAQLKDDDKNNAQIEEMNKMLYKCQDVKHSLKLLYKRQKSEKEKREKINTILGKCKDEFNNIKSKLNEYRIKERKLKEI